MSGIVRHANVIQCWKQDNFTGEIGAKWENRVKFFRRGLWCSILFLRFSELCTCIPSGCCTKEGSPKVSEGLTEDHIGTEGGDVFCCLKSCRLLDRRNQQIDDSFV